MFDGIFIHGRLHTGIKMASSDNLPSTTAIRADSNVPVFLLQSEMDVALASGTSKQVDSDHIRHWEVAGTTHADHVNKYKAAADAALAKGYIRPADHAHALVRAQAADVPQ